MRPQVVWHGEVSQNVGAVAKVSLVVSIIANFVQIQQGAMLNSNMHFRLSGRPLAGAASTRHVFKVISHGYVAISNALCSRAVVYHSRQTTGSDAGDLGFIVCACTKFSHNAKTECIIFYVYPCLGCLCLARLSSFPCPNLIFYVLFGESAQSAQLEQRT